MLVPAGPVPPLTDPFQRRITYLRVSVTDRCDFRCLYCMAEEMDFLPKAEVLGLEELERLCTAFIRLGVRRLRLTGGEPLVRRDVMTLVAALGRQVAADALDELTLTTNGSQLARHAAALAAAGVRRVNVSLDSLEAGRFARITRRGRLDNVLDGIAAARAAGIAVKLNVVALRGLNDDEFIPLVEWAHGQGHEVTFIETMPLGDVDGDRTAHYLPLGEVRAALARRFTLIDSAHRSAGPARYVRIAETGGRVGFITPLSDHFCDSCNRVRLTCTGRLYLCLGQEDSVDFLPLLRGGADDPAIEAAIRRALAHKPRGHDFVIDRATPRPALARHMNVTGG
ncbi:GTP 3',8-cyclase MoaA [Zavarzinia compransoris]|uniref:GTP 3',8-cyclase n=1 Tax=Zavarzinia compransoris TaxID=1264899 RepID=A0A317E472_9PROT|nr:GTP 3',8-cyclase MoaA [Zavarzinia compransoris]PWR21010.1 GTP 3',8-cyclase MoaA [Zavarzinia compransoris]TDP44042.1 cyclic pyranopterin monophosphate synthase subunit MoaA [Zavarzinia compransoris]